jgi:hypothetical protein
MRIGNGSLLGRERTSEIKATFVLIPRVANVSVSDEFVVLPSQATTIK